MARIERGAVKRAHPAAFDPAAIAGAVEAALRGESRRLDGEQAVRGVDSLDELTLHPILARSLSDAGFGVFGEERYPSARARRNRSQGDRCDLVLTPAGGELAAPDRAPTLFDPPDPVGLADAFWLEVKVVNQHLEGGPNTAYASTLVAALDEDAAKLARDPIIRHAGIVVILFAESAAVAVHDLDAALETVVAAGAPLHAGVRRVLPIADRLGNAVAAIDLLRVSAAR